VGDYGCPSTLTIQEQFRARGYGRPTKGLEETPSFSYPTRARSSYCGSSTRAAASFGAGSAIRTARSAGSSTMRSSWNASWSGCVRPSAA